jgi:hypothetical protein
MNDTSPSDGDIDSNLEVHSRYEEANRLLGEMNLDRRQRYNTE